MWPLKVISLTGPGSGYRKECPSKPPGGQIVNIPVWWEMLVAEPFPSLEVTTKPTVGLLTHPHQRISFRLGPGVSGQQLP